MIVSWELRTHVTHCEIDGRAALAAGDVEPDAEFRRRAVESPADQRAPVGRSGGRPTEANQAAVTCGGAVAQAGLQVGIFGLGRRVATVVRIEKDCCERIG